MLTLLILITTAMASECRLLEGLEEGDRPMVSATMTMVTIEGRTYPVKGTAARMSFANELRACDLHQAAMYFDQWRAARRATNWLGGGGALCFWPLLIGVPFTATNAGNAKAAMVSAIMQGS